MANDYASILKIVEPGNPEKSMLYHVITNVNGEVFMPPDKPLSFQQRTLLHLWIKQGALNNNCIDTSLVIEQPNIPSDTLDTLPVVENVDTICFKQDILPMFVSGCALSGCHDASSHREGYVLTDYENIIKNKDGISPFEPDESEIYKVLNKTGEGRMPPPPREAISAEQREELRKWIAEGAINSDCPDTATIVGDTVSFSQDVWPIINMACVGCHNSLNANAGIILDSYDNIVSVSNTERNNYSLLLGVIKYQDGFANMPPPMQLDVGQIGKIEKWVEEGKKNN